MSSPLRTRVRSMMLLVTAISLLATACGAPESNRPSDDPDPAEPMQIVATTAIVGDLVQEVAGDRATVSVLIGRDRDPHEFTASSADIAMMADADLVIASGLGLEAGIVDVLAAVDEDGTPVVSLGELVEPIPFSFGTTGADALDPHFWHDPMRMTIAADLVAGALSELRPVDSSIWHANAATVVEEITAAHHVVVQTLSSLEPDQRTLVTNHDSLSYFADRYEFEVIASVMPGSESITTPSAADLTDLVVGLRNADTKVIFTETTQSEDLARTVAAELGHDVAIVQLYSGGLGPVGSRAETYVGMLVVNAELIATALAG